MKDKCIDCGKCCLETEMIVSSKDIELILKKAPNHSNMREFAILSDDGFYKLKNIDGHCVFFDLSSKNCVIYDIRPQGCRFYPLIYDYENDECIFDNHCPRTHLFYRNKQEFKLMCEKIRKFLKEQLKMIL